MPILAELFTLAETRRHTVGMLHTTAPGAHQQLFFCADLVPGIPWIRLPITMGYDRFPEQLVDEKSAILEAVAGSDTWLAFTHDPRIAFARLERDGEGGYHARDPRTDELGGFDLDAPIT